MSDEPVLHVKPGDGLRFAVTVTDLTGALVDPSALTLTLEPPAGALDTPIVDPSPVRDSIGAYHSDQLIPFTATPGPWTRRWRSTGAAVDSNRLREKMFYVDALDF